MGYYLSGTSIPFHPSKFSWLLSINIKFDGGAVKLCHWSLNVRTSLLDLSRITMEKSSESKLTSIQIVIIVLIQICESINSKNI